MNVKAVWYPKTMDYDLLEVGSNELIDGGFNNLKELSDYCSEHGYILTCVEY